MNNLNRLSVFKEKCANDTYYFKKLVLSVDDAEFDQVVEFIEENDNLSHLEFEYKINRMHVGLPVKSKHWTTVQEILIITNTAAVYKAKGKS